MPHDPKCPNCGKPNLNPRFPVNCQCGKEKNMICSICQEEFTAKNCFNEWTVKHGNNAAPVNDGQCCDICDAEIVIPARINRIKRTSRLATG